MASHSAMSSSVVRSARSRTWSSFMPSHQYCAADLGRDGLALAHLADELAWRDLAGGRADDVGGHRRARPTARSRSGCVQSSGAMLRSCAANFRVLDRGDRHGLVVLDPGDGRRRRDGGHGHRAAFRCRRSSRTRRRTSSTTRSVRRIQRSPPGSLATCWSASPAIERREQVDVALVGDAGRRELGRAPIS